MSLKINVLIAILVLLVLSLFVVEIVGGKNSAAAAYVVHYNTNATSVVGSPWLKKVAKWSRPRPVGCRGRPWICRQSELPGTRMQCCRDQCVDVSSDPENCGLCGVHCPFTRQCCRGFCSNTSRSPINCGRCGNRCPCGIRCRYGMCGYAGGSLPCPPQPRPQPRRPRPPSPPYGDQPPPMSTEDL
ncbi:hypothetical protein JRO89_XS15G0165900 [Xanthoceras sorbifolium]|uniref:Stigma-specific Stig1 family protein n=1 Tax=Xanthoceras sorbifolium TaxID=99658 RepID=A0ABQ8H2J2_9ROSI|nr:hypothetical protein JRO89_XS15G0165900 [Xanthoceras sorbifolium]